VSSADPLLRLYGSLPRKSPGSAAATREALRRLGPVPPRARVLDLGCGTGSATFVLAEALERPRIVAVDLLKAFLDELDAEAAKRGIGDAIETRERDMIDPGVTRSSVDLLWCEGAIYNVGFKTGLAAWRPLLRPGAAVAVSELCFTSDQPPPESARYWKSAYPPMTTVDANARAAAAAGYEVIGTLPLPEEAWWREYYEPLEARADALADEATRDPELLSVVRDAREEIDARRRFGSSYAYVFFLLRPRAH